MKKSLKALFLFLLPIFKTALSQAVAEKVLEYAYPEGKGPRGYNQHGVRNPHTPGTVNYTRWEQGIRRPAPSSRRYVEPKFDGVVMIAFDIIGPNQAVVEEWLNSRLPAPGRHGILNLELRSVKTHGIKLKENSE